MQALRGGWLSNRLMTAALSAALCCGVTGLGTAAMGQGAAASPISLELRDGLQGMRFIGSLGVEDGTNPDNEILTFKDGRFSSQICLEYGFAPAPYWVRRDVEGLHFLAELENPENGTIRFEGVFDGKEMRATALWTKERWYWTIEQTLVFKGRAFEQAE